MTDSDKNTGTVEQPEDLLDPEETQEFKIPLPRAQYRGALRRRVLFILILMATVPGYVALLLSWYAASQTIQSSARDRAWDMASSMQLEIDRGFMARAASLERIAQSDRFARQIRPWIERTIEQGVVGEPLRFESPLRFENTGLQNARLFIINSRGRLLAEIKRDGALGDFEIPHELEGAPILERISRTMPRKTFAGDLPLQSDWENPSLFLGTRVVDLPDEHTPLLLATLVPLRPVFTEIERLNPSFGQRLIIISERAGVIYSTQQDKEFALSLGRRSKELLEEEPSPDLKEMRVRGTRLGVAHSSVRSLALLTLEEKVEPVRWAVAQTVNLDAVLDSLRRELWIAIIVGLFLTVVAVILATLLSRKMTGPILRLTEGMQRYAQGDLDYRVDVRTGDEIESLAAAANEMAASLRLSYQNLGKRMEQLDEKASQLELIHSISHSVNRVLDLDKLFARIIREILIHIPCERVSLGMLTESRDGLALEYVYPADREVLSKGTVVPLEDSVMGRALHDQVLTLRRLRSKGRYYEDKSLGPEGMTMLCIVPLVATNGPVGTLNLASDREGSFGRSEIKLLERIADSLALAVEHGRLYTRVARFAEELEETVEIRTRELRAAQAKLVQTEKFAATGSIAAHIGHEINNPLSIIKNYMKLLEGRVKKPARAESDLKSVREGLEVIDEEIDRIARIVSQLRQVSKPSRPENQRINLVTEISKIIELFEASARKRGIEIELQLDPEVEEVVICRDYLRQILINLLRNSVDAMEAQAAGVITMATGRMDHEPGYYFIEVRDTGPGIPQDSLNSIFDPFFTTKAEGKGTGLGLSVSFGLAQTMGGRMEANSVVGEGSTLRLVLPFEPETPDSVDEEEPPTKTNGGLSPDETGGRRRRGERIIIG